MKSKLFVFSAFDWLFTVGMIVGMFFLLATSFLDKNNQAILYMYQTKYEKAEQKWLQILSEKPFSPHYRMNLAFNYMSGNQLDKALREYEVSGNMLAVLSSVGGTVSDNVKFDIRKKIFFNSAVIFTQQQQVDRALNFYQRALEVDPDFNEAKVNIELLVRGRQILPPEQSQEQEKEEEEKGDEKKDEEKEDKKGEGEKEKEKGGEKEKEEKKQKKQDKQTGQDKGNKQQKEQEDKKGKSPGEKEQEEPEEQKKQQNQKEPEEQQNQKEKSDKNKQQKKEQGQPEGDGKEQEKEKEKEKEQEQSQEEENNKAKGKAPLGGAGATSPKERSQKQKTGLKLNEKQTEAVLRAILEQENAIRQRRNRERQSGGASLEKDW